MPTRSLAHSLEGPLKIPKAWICTRTAHSLIHFQTIAKSRGDSEGIHDRPNHDIFEYRNKEYSVAGISEGKLFDISVFGLKPSWKSTACWRGYQAVFAVDGSRLLLDRLLVNLLKPGEGKDRFESEVGPVINGVSPSASKTVYFNNHYKRLNYHVEYSGGLLLADGFIQSLYVHMGFQPAWKYQNVIELVFEGGILKKEFDCSNRMAEIREMVSTSQYNESVTEMPSEQKIRQFMERAFDRAYWR